MTTDNATQIGMSANAADYHSTIRWIQLQKAKGNGEFHLPNGKLYPFLHIENPDEYWDDKIVGAFTVILESSVKTAYAAMKLYSSWAGEFPSPMVGAGSNHIYFQESFIEGGWDRKAIIYFDPYEI